MKTVKLGGIVASTRMGYGAMSLCPNIYKPQEGFTDEDGVDLVKRCFQLGLNHIDTALVYGNGHSETLVGRAIAGLSPEERAKLCIATKTGVDRSNGGLKIRGDAEFIRQTCLECKARLGTYIDIFYLHRIDTSVPIEDSMRTLKQLVEEGHIKAIGLSEASASTIRRAHAVHPIAAVQLEWSLWVRDAEAEVIPTCRELGIAIVAYSPLGRGALTGNLKSREDLKDGDARLGNGRFQPEVFEQNLKLVSKIEQLASQKGVSPAQLSLAWVLAQGEDVVPIPGTAKVKNLEANVAALDIDLSPQEVKDLSDAIPTHLLTGGRNQPGLPLFKDN